MDRPALEQLLAAAIETGEILRIVYRGGSRPGAVREVRPLVMAPAWVQAHDIAAGVDKVFLLDKMEITAAPVTPAGWPRTVQDAIAPRMADLLAPYTVR